MEITGLKCWTWLCLQAGGPSWTVLLGRRDATSPASPSEATAALPNPNTDMTTIIGRFSAVGLSTQDTVVLSGESLFEMLETIFFKLLFSARCEGPSKNRFSHPEVLDLFSLWERDFFPSYSSKHHECSTGVTPYLASYATRPVCDASPVEAYDVVVIAKVGAIVGICVKLLMVFIQDDVNIEQ